MKKKRIIILLISILTVFLVMIGLYFYGLTSVSKDSEKITFNIKKGSGKKEIINNLYESKLIKSKIASTIYVLTHPSLIVQAGTYSLNRNYSTQEIFEKLSVGDVLDDSVTITFIEGKRIVDYISQITSNFNYTEADIIAVLEDETYLKSLINKYDFIDNSILNNDIYYSLEGYLFPSTYQFAKDDSIKTILEKMLDKTEKVLDNYNASILASGYTYHEILTIASIIENEVQKDEDRSPASRVIYNRLNKKMSLGMDSTATYGANKGLATPTKEELDAYNAYNTRNTNFIGLPVGPISNPGEKSIKAALNPSDGDYLYFLSDSSGKLHFSTTYEDFLKNKANYS